jgi:hypothetical protein
MVHQAYFIYQVGIIAQESTSLHVLVVCVDWRGLKILKTKFAKGDLSKKEYEDIAISNRDILRYLCLSVVIVVVVFPKNDKIF